MSRTQETEKKIFELRSRFTGDRQLVVAIDQADALKQVDGDIDRFAINEVRQYHRKETGAGCGYLVKIPTETCPYQYASCDRPTVYDCPLMPYHPELQEWLKRAHEAHLCSFTGHQLTKKDHMLKQKWVTMKDAVNELTAKL